MMTRHMHSRKFFWMIPIGIAALAVMSFVVFMLWNWLVPAIFGLPAITYYQAVGLFFLSKILFSGVGRGRHPRPHWKARWAKECEDHYLHEEERSTNENA